MDSCLLLLFDVFKSEFTHARHAKFYLTIGCPQLVGISKQVADQMEVILEETGGDGFNITPATVLSSFIEFVDEVVPMLQKRGVHRREYTGQTLRDNL